MRSLWEALGEVAEEWVVVEGTVEGGIVALELLLEMDVADVGVDGRVEMEDWVAGLGLWVDEVARFVYVEGGEVTCGCCWCCDEDDAVGGCC